jgi:translation initiation factor 5B
VFHKTSPLVCGVRVIEGTLRLKTPICVTTKADIYLGRVASIEVEHKPLEQAETGMEVCVRIESDAPTTFMFGRHFDATDELASKITRTSLDKLKQLHGAELTDEDKILLFNLKKHYKIM